MIRETEDTFFNGSSRKSAKLLRVSGVFVSEFYCIVFDGAS